MEPTMDTLREVARVTRMRFRQGEITEAEALVLIAPFVKAYRKLAAAKAKEAGIRPPPFSAARFLRARFDLTWDAEAHRAES